MGRCEVCLEKPTHTCVYDGQPMLDFCEEHYVEHLREAHHVPASEIRKLVRSERHRPLEEIEE